MTQKQDSAPEQPIETLAIPIEETAKGIKYITIRKKEWELAEESVDYWKLRKI